MLISFTFKNVFSFADETTLDMQATKIEAHRYSLLETRNSKIIPVAAIYGANASGKTNIILALREMIKMMSGNRADESIPFLFRIQDEMLPLSEYSIILAVGGYPQTEYKYRVTLELDRNVYEALYARIPGKSNKFVLIFERSWDDVRNKWVLRNGKTDVARKLAEEIKFVSSMVRMQGDLLLPSLGKRNASQVFRSIYNWVQGVSFNYYPYLPNKGSPSFKKTDKIYDLLTEEEGTCDLLRFIRTINPMIDGVSSQEQMTPGTGESVFILGIKYDYPGRNTDFEPYLHNLESRGLFTAAFMFPHLRQVLENGGIFVVDEIENSLHPLLLAQVINLFTSPETNPGGGQLIFTTHNALIMDRKYLRRDEIMFVEKNEAGESDLYRLSDIEGVRSDTDFCRNYILGSFGAVPVFPSPEVV